MAPTEEDVKRWKDQEGEAIDMAQAHRDLARGDQAAAAIEADLDRFHSKLDALLDALEDKQPAAAAGNKPSSVASSTTAVASAATESSVASVDAGEAGSVHDKGPHSGHEKRKTKEKQRTVKFVIPGNEEDRQLVETAAAKIERAGPQADGPSYPDSSKTRRRASHATSPHR
ncbi:hypothetical protein G6O67_007173 [Ophiocordyceps sinensis]|uniref:Uncharacterized protein n=1 Tax=Ophiocordyceps sinensis TaxID=72228 RepID=A0A8H4LTM1_9HYPO|nr:hypothetical protein G6O67_007173 [Ophiocordyceps sinensis]